MYLLLIVKDRPLSLSHKEAVTAGKESIRDQTDIWLEVEKGRQSITGSLLVNSDSEHEMESHGLLR